MRIRFDVEANEEDKISHMRRNQGSNKYQLSQNAISYHKNQSLLNSYKEDILDETRRRRVHKFINNRSNDRGK